MPVGSLGFYRVLSAAYIKCCPLVFATLSRNIKLISILSSWNSFDSLGMVGRSVAGLVFGCWVFSGGSAWW